MIKKGKAWETNDFEKRFICAEQHGSILTIHKGNHSPIGILIK